MSVSETFNIDTEQGIRNAERFKSRHENLGASLSVEPFAGGSYVRITARRLREKKC